MDSLTQIVLGAAVAEAVGGKKLGNKAPLWGAIAGTIPDLDVFLRFFYHLPLLLYRNVVIAGESPFPIFSDFFHFFVRPKIPFIFSF